MKICVLGANGMLGYAVKSYFVKKGNEVFGLTRNDYDIARDTFSFLKDFINTNEIQVVINCSGVIKPRIAAMTIEDVIEINSVFPGNLAKLCKSLMLPCFHITTDCVYSGKKGQYDEDDYYDAVDVYGKTKSAGEPSNAMVIRTSIIGEEKGASRSLLEWVRSESGNTINGFTNHLWNGVTTLHLAEIINTILHDGLYKEGTYHIFSPNYLNKYELLNDINNVYNLGITINAIEAKEAVNSTLSSKYDLNKRISTITILEQLKRMEKFFNRSRRNQKNDYFKMPLAHVEYA